MYTRYVVTFRRLLITGFALMLIVVWLVERTHAEPSQPQIVGGSQANPHEFPWQVALTLSDHTYCGGSLVASTWVVTAAHCVANGISGLRVELGIHDISVLSNNDPWRQTFAIKRVIIHPQYGHTVIYGDYDIALIELDSTITQTDAVRPIALASYLNTALYTPSTLTDTSHWPIVSGWGATRYGGSTARYLQKVAVPLVSNTTCNANYDGGITDRMVCAGLPQGGIDSCQGDSGGPLFIENQGTPLLIGIVSMGEGCAWPNYPGIYTHVANLYPWIATYVPLDPLPTVTASRTLTATSTPTATRTTTASATRTASKTVTASRTPTVSRTPSWTRTATATQTPSHTRTATRTATSSRTATPLPDWMQRVLNGNFEAGNHVWYESSLQYPNIITQETRAVPARSGLYFAWLAGANNDVSVITQTVRVRGDATFLRLYYMAASDEACGKVSPDTAQISFNDAIMPNGNLVLCKGKNVTSWRALTFNLAGYIDQEVTIRIEARTNASVPSSMWVDDVGFVRTANEPLNYYGKSSNPTLALPRMR